ncbi:hypothetical protein [Ruegeria arenilitoris]|uniref:hypothetical protein n=1 Tax=Ruegeria arenilitoris TaxID=1173585 RepID=UPI00147C379D|nr:hypothetical protein [Ruegeria arenilitoris]
MSIAEEITERQIRIDNPPTGFFVDGGGTRPVSQMKNNLAVTYQGGRNIRPIMDRLLQEARAIRGVTWQWLVTSRDARRQTQLRSIVNGSGPFNITFGDRVYLVPVKLHSTPDPTHLNARIAQWKRRTKSGRTTSRGRQVGLYHIVARSLRRTAGRQGIYVRAVHSLKNIPGRELPPGVSIGQRVGGLYYQGSWGFMIRVQTGRRIR